MSLFQESSSCMPVSGVVMENSRNICVVPTHDDVSNEQHNRTTKAWMKETANKKQCTIDNDHDNRKTMQRK